MGIPVDPEYGEACEPCEDKLWVAGKTPLHIWVEFTDIEPCPDEVPPALGSFKMTQLDGHPCVWEFDNGNIVAAYDAFNSIMLFGQRDPISSWFFAVNLLEHCAPAGDNEQDCGPDGIGGEGGSYSLFSYSLGHHLIYGLSLCPHFGFRCEYAIPSDYECVRLVSKRYSTNILVKYQVA